MVFILRRYCFIPCNVSSNRVSELSWPSRPFVEEERWLLLCVEIFHYNSETWLARLPVRILVAPYLAMLLIRPFCHPFSVSPPSNQHNTTTHSDHNVSSSYNTIS